MKERLSLTALFVLTSFHAGAWETLPARTDGAPDFTYTQSPPDWRDIPIYQVITDRFFDGDPDNNDDHPDGLPNPYAADGIHGGDFRGLEQKLGYIQMLGARAVWISPVFRNVGGAYHGYYTMDFSSVDPHWGTLDELRHFVDAAHRRGIYVVIDVVFNHMGRLVTSDEPSYPAWNPDGYALRWRDPNQRYAPPFDDLARLHALGSIENWDDPVQYVLGDLRGLPDLRTEDARVRQDLVRIFSALIAATDCDGFRVDTARHVAPEDWTAMLPPLYRFCEGIGKTNFLCFGESLVYDDDQVGVLTRGDRFNSMLYYPMYATFQDVFVHGRPTQSVTERLAQKGAYDEPARDQLVAFLDNHDKARFLHADSLGGDSRRMKTALALLYTGPYVPCLYYGTEQGFNGAKGHTAREDMFDGEFERGPSLGDNFDPTHELFRWVRKLHQLREAYAPLRNGAFIDRWHDPDGRGLYVFSRRSEGEEVLVALNTHREIREAGHHGLGPETSLPERTVLVNALDPKETLVVGSGGATNRVHLQVPGDGVKVYVPEHTFTPLPPTVEQVVPAHDSYGVKDPQTITLTFDQSMDRELVEDAFSLSTGAEGTFAWNDRNTVLQFIAEKSWPADETITLRLREDAASATGVLLGANFETRFRTGPARTERVELGSFVMDGQLDGGVPALATNGTQKLYARFDAGHAALYVATEDAGEGFDIFILLTDRPSTDARFPPPWAKAGKVAGLGPFLADENDNDFSGWRQVTGSAVAGTGKNGGVLEGVINLEQHFGDLPSAMYLAVAGYATAEGGDLAPSLQVPVPVWPDGDVEPEEFLRLPLIP